MPFRAQRQYSPQGSLARLPGDGRSQECFRNGLCKPSPNRARSFMTQDISGAPPAHNLERSSGYRPDAPQFCAISLVSCAMLRVRSLHLRPHHRNPFTAQNFPVVFAYKFGTGRALSRSVSCCEVGEVIRRSWFCWIVAAEPAAPSWFSTPFACTGQTTRSPR